MKTQIIAIDQILEETELLVNELAAKYLQQLISNLKKENEELIKNKLENPIRYSLCNPREYVEGMFNRKIEDYKKSLVFDMIKSLSKNLIVGDESIGEIYLTRKAGSIELSTIIKRDGVQYPFSTEMILAGGYNIQCLHYRYITRTNLPKNTDTSWFKNFAKQIKLEQEVKNYANIVASLESKLDLMNSQSDEQVVGEYYVKSNISKTFPTYLSQEEIKECADRQRGWAKRDIEGNRKQLKKYQSKLEQLINL